MSQIRSTLLSLIDATQATGMLLVLTTIALVAPLLVWSSIVLLVLPNWYWSSFGLETAQWVQHSAQ